MDVQKNYLVFTVVGFATDATPFVIDYGTFPKQSTTHFDRRTATKTIDSVYAEGDQDAKFWQAFDGLMTDLLTRNFKREDGLAMSLKKVCIDVRYKGLLIKRYVRQSKHRDVLLPGSPQHCIAANQSFWTIRTS